VNDEVPRGKKLICIPLNSNLHREAAEIDIVVDISSTALRQTWRDAESIRGGEMVEGLRKRGECNSFGNVRRVKSSVLYFLSKR
jgi:hypothetical protein